MKPDFLYNFQTIPHLHFLMNSENKSLLIFKSLIHIFASQGLRSALLIFTLGIVRRIFVIPAHCHLLDFDSYAPCNDVIFSQSTRSFHFLSFECPENWLEIIIRLIFKRRFVNNLWQILQISSIFILLTFFLQNMCFL